VPAPRPTRRQLLLGGTAALGVGASASAVWSATPWRIRAGLGLTPDPWIPDAPEGVVRLERVDSAAVPGGLDLFTAVPAGHGEGAGLPVVVVLHGSSASAADFRGFGLPRFVSAAVEGGAAPFVLAGTDDGPVGWVPGGGADPQAMLAGELPGWLADRGYDASRIAVWGWSRGGYGALRMALDRPGWARAAALFSPALGDAEPDLDALAALESLPLGVWCGIHDIFYEPVRSLVRRLPAPPEVTTWEDAGHTRVFWNRHTIPALTWLAGHLTPATTP
jgi:pimeloyl-ACP methyl ester carboxylesterase